MGVQLLDINNLNITLSEIPHLLTMGPWTLEHFTETVSYLVADRMLFANDSQYIDRLGQAGQQKSEHTRASHGLTHPADILRNFPVIQP